MNPCSTHLKSRIHFLTIHSVLSPSLSFLLWILPLAWIVLRKVAYVRFVM